MKLLRSIAIISLLLAVALPVAAADNRSGAGFALVRGSVDANFLPESLDFTGFTLFWKYGFTDSWGLLVSYRSMEDDENLLFGEEDEYDQLSVHAVYMWRHGMRVRPHIKFGLARTDFEVRLPGGSVSEDDTAISIGGGLEAGSEKVAFYADYDFSEPEFDFLVDDLELYNLSLGMIFKY